MNPKVSSKHLNKRTGQYSGSRKRWWQTKLETVSVDDPPSVQRYQFDPNMGGRPRFEQTPPSPAAFAQQYGDNTLGWHVEKLLRGLHELSGN